MSGGNQTLSQWQAGIGSMSTEGWPQELAWRAPQFIADVRAFLASPAAAQAFQNGWTDTDFFGVDARYPARAERLGLIWRLQGGRIVQIGFASATYRTGAGVTSTFTKPSIGFGRIPAWQIAGRSQGKRNAAPTA